jgi:hypothetical protein
MQTSLRDNIKIDLTEINHEGESDQRWDLTLVLDLTANCLTQQ